MTTSAIRIAVIGAALGLVAAGCGGGSAGPSMTAGAAGQLHTGVDAVHAAVASGDRAQAVDALATLQTTVTQLRRGGQVSSDRAAAIVAAATEVEAQLGFMPTTTTTTTTPPPPPRPRRRLLTVNARRAMGRVAAAINRGGSRLLGLPADRAPFRLGHFDGEDPDLGARADTLGTGMPSVTDLTARLAGIAQDHDDRDERKPDRHPLHQR